MKNNLLLFALFLLSSLTLTAQQLYKVSKTIERAQIWYGKRKRYAKNRLYF
jgi:hypothetical protein